MREAAVNEARHAAIEKTRRVIGLGNLTRSQKQKIHPRKEAEPKSFHVATAERILIGTEAQQKEGDEAYEVVWPIKEGRLDLTPGSGRTPSLMMEDLTELWTRVIELHCRISAVDFPNYKVMFLVPDQFLKRDIRLMLDVLLKNMKFSDAFIHQESVCAAFGSGLSTACVVDIGHEKFSVACVDEGISINRARAYFPFGGKNIQELLCHLLCNSPSYILSDGENGTVDVETIQSQSGITTITESLCHLDMDDESHKLFDLVVSEKDMNVVRIYPLNLREELILSPMGFFHPEMFKSYYEEKYFENNQSYHEPYDCLNSATYVDMGGTLGRYAEKGPKDTVSSKGIDSADKLSLDAAIVASVRQVGNPELYVKLLSNIVLAGGSSIFPKLQNVLIEMVQSRAKAIPELENCQIEVVNTATHYSPADLSWKGAAIVCCAPSVQDCWVSSKEWERDGISKVREKSCFRW